MKPRVFVIGWDGATFDLIRPWVKEGKLPTIAKLMEEGVYGNLRSTLPPMTFPAWTSFMTGKNPGKHGIFDFTRPRAGTYELEFVNGGKRQGKTFWQILSDAGREVVSISLPCTFPPNKVNGVMISGFDAPGGGPGSHVDARGMYPPGLYDELLCQVGQHPIGASIVKEINQGRPDLAMEQVRQTIARKAATAKYLIRSRTWDCFMILFGESDMLGHQLWKYCDPSSPLFTDKPSGMRDSLLGVYQELDRQAAELIGMLPSDTTVLMMSDHGFGGVSDWMLYPNCWLRERGLLRFRGGWAQRTSRILDTAKLFAVSRLPAPMRKWIYKVGGNRLGQFESRVRFGMIDWQGTLAYCEENPYYPAFWINLKGRQPEGIVEPGEEYEKACKRLIEELENWRHPATGAPIVEKAYQRKDVYHGPYKDQAPDVIAKWGLHHGYSYAFKLSAKSGDLQWIEQVDPTRPENLQYYTSKSGSHRDDGIFVAKGPGILAGVPVVSAEIIDVAPTILKLLGVDAPSDMDGKALSFVSGQSTGKFDTTSREAIHQDVSSPDTTNGYSADDEEKIAERLKSLGYVE
jgi:predicted AlkP superfamily phosphohydrolase/phosphomutase